MVRQLTTKAQVNGYRFLLRRQEHALVRRDVRMLHDPMRSERTALFAGLLIATLVLGGCGVYGLVRPQGNVGDATILLSKSSGAMYVRLDDRLHPVLNLASARLIVGTAASPKSVGDSVLARYPRGPLLGIPGAPSSLPTPSGGSSDWAVCDSDGGRGADVNVRTTTLIIGPPAPGSITATRDAALLTASDGIYLVYQVPAGDRARPVRARIDTASVPVRRALGAENAVARPASPGLLNSLPRMPDLVVPAVAGVGRASVLGADISVGSVVKTVDAAGRQSHFAVLSDGVQRISSVVADILVLGGWGGAAEVEGTVRAINPATLVGVPVSDVLAVAHYPSVTPRLVDIAAAPVLCHEWHGGSDGSSYTRLRFATQVPTGADQRVAVPVGADGGGPGLDEVAVPPGQGLYIRLTGIEPDSPRRESRYLVSDNGIRYGVGGIEEGAMLGLGEDADLLAPWPMLALLTAGPALARADALVAHAGMSPDTAAVPISVEGPG
ncbi:type VII secretion protein EccB [Gordonia sp. CPCC 205333]|uniref:type VII secretion protein EccB n=1 Tax=Gordonia sp. CPCC 205333 TaxID=3140790 RepID=UPI003AF374BC